MYDGSYHGFSQFWLKLVLQIETWTRMFIYKNSRVGSYILLLLCFVTIACSITIAL